VALGLTLLFAETDSTAGLPPAFGLITREHPDAILLQGGPLFYANRRSIIDFSTRNRFPLMGDDTIWAEDGALMSYSVQRGEVSRLVASFVDRILRGAKPADLPMEHPSKFELVINLKTAKGLGLTIPPPLFQRADRVIE
jgi:putative ABC transport system substrate-binding protein